METDSSLIAVVKFREVTKIIHRFCSSKGIFWTVNKSFVNCICIILRNWICCFNEKHVISLKLLCYETVISAIHHCTNCAWNVKCGVSLPSSCLGSYTSKTRLQDMSRPARTADIVSFKLTRQKKLKQSTIFTRKPRRQVRILMYQKWAIRTPYSIFLKCQFDENWHQFFPHFFAQNNQFNRKTFFDVNKIGYNDSSGREKLLQPYESLVRH